MMLCTKKSIHNPMSISILPADLTVGKPLEGLKKQTIGNARRTQTSTRIPNGREDAAVEGLESLDKSTVAALLPILTQQNSVFLADVGNPLSHSKT